MKRSRDRILTTHVGSLPRSGSVLDLLVRKEAGEALTPDAAQVFRDGVAEIVQKQVSLGIDVISDGEVSKISYATYVKDRLDGFEDRETDRRIHLDLKDFPELRRKMAALTGPQLFRRPVCVAPVSSRGLGPLMEDIRNLKDAAAEAGATEAFMNAASPGVVATFLPNVYYDSHEAYVEAIGEAMREEYEAIAGSGLILQIDSPDLAMGRHTTFQDLTEDEFVSRACVHVEALNHALRNVPVEQIRLHLCWGNYEGPHTHDIELSRIIDCVLGVKTGAIVFEAANPRHAHEWEVWRDGNVADELILVPGVIDTSTNYVEHPELVAQRIRLFADLFGRERVIAGTDCGFGTSAGYGKLDPAVAYLKLDALVTGARLASERLWKRG